MPLIRMTWPATLEQTLDIDQQVFRCTTHVELGIVQGEFVEIEPCRHAGGNQRSVISEAASIEVVIARAQKTLLLFGAPCRWSPLLLAAEIAERRLQYAGWRGHDDPQRGIGKDVFAGGRWGALHLPC